MEPKRTTPKTKAVKRPTKATVKAAVEPTRTAVVVMGMHRSGTSALAGVLARLGCDLPATEMPTTKSNSKGFYESNEIYLLNNNLLESAGLDWQDWQPFPQNWQKSPRAVEFATRVKDVFSAEFADSSLFVVKDPRICRLFPIWKQVLQNANCEPAIVHTHRNPLEVATSLESRNRIPKTIGLLIWLRYVLDSEFHTRGMLRTFTSYTQILKNWPSETDKIETDLKLTFPRRSIRSQSDIHNFLTQDLKHFSFKTADVSEDPMVPVWVRDVFLIMERWSETGEKAADRKKLDKINADFSSTSLIYGLAHDAAASAAVEKVDQTIRETESAHKKIMVEKDNTINQFKNEVKTLQYEIEAGQKEIENLNSRLQESQDDRESLSKSLERRTKQNQEKTKQTADLSAEIEVMKSQLETLDNRNRKTNDQLKITQTERDNRDLQVKEECLRSEGLQAELQTVKSELETQSTQTSVLRTQLDETISTLRSSNDELATTRSSLAQRQHESDESYKKIKELKSQIETLNDTYIKLEAARNLDQIEAKKTLETTVNNYEGIVKNHLKVNLELSGQLQTRYNELGHLIQIISKSEIRHAQSIEELQSKIRHLEDDIKFRSKAIGDLEKNLSVLLQDKDINARELSLSNSKVVELSNNLEENRNSLEKLEKMYRLQKAEHQTYEQEQIDQMRDIQKQLDTVTSERVYLQHAWDNVMSSSSWRITKPLRSLAHFLRRHS